MTAAPIISSQSDDTALITASRSGDRAAFGQIVRRYQGMIAGLIYASVGDVHRSEDLAQETFVSAWKSLSGLREPAKLPAWLCQIARHRILDHVRSAARQKSNFADFQKHQQPIAATSADAPIISAEENELLWRTLSQMPQPYREALVLYYRQGHSTTDVAAAMETTEAAVRQRLSRGREMLRENLAQLLEKNLARTAPSEAFTLAVIAALPAMVGSTVKAAMIGAAAKGSTVGATAIFSFFAFAIPPIMGLWGGIIGARSGLKGAQSPAERRFVIRKIVWIAFFVLVSITIQIAAGPVLHHFNGSAKQFIVLLSVFLALYGLIVVTFIRWTNRKHMALRKAEGLPNPVPPANARRKPPLMMILGVPLGSMVWMIALAIQASDTRAVEFLTAVIAVFLIVALVRVRSHGQIFIGRFGIYYTLAIAVFTLITMNWRMQSWMAASEHLSLVQVQQRLPLWCINLLTITIWTLIAAMMFATDRRRPREIFNDVKSFL